jgi:hypothetical protein
MAKAEISVATLTEPEYAEWNRFVSTAPTGSVYSRTEYLDALCAATGGRFRILVVRQGEQIFGGVGLYEEDTRFGVVVSPRLLLYYNGPVLRQHETKYPSEQTARGLKALVALEADIRGRGYGQVILKPRSPLTDVRPFLACGWDASHGYTYVVSITDLEQTRARIEQNLRRLIDRCGRAEFSVTVDDDFDSFFKLHTSTMARVEFRAYLAAPAFRGYYETLARQGLAQLFHARLPDGRAIASQLVLLGHPVTHTVSAGADPEYMKSGVSAFLRWKVFEHLSAGGYHANDLTDASLNPVTHFKSQLGGSLEPWIELRSSLSPRLRWGTRATTLAQSARGVLGAVVRRRAGQEAESAE